MVKAANDCNYVGVAYIRHYYELRIPSGTVGTIINYFDYYLRHKARIMAGWKEACATRSPKAGFLHSSELQRRFPPGNL